MTGSVPNRFEDDVGFVTGSTRSIGARIAHQFAAEGAAVVISGRDAKAGEAVRTEIRDAGGEAVFLRTDLREPDDVAALFEGTVTEFTQPTVIVNNAAVQTNTAPDEVTTEVWDRVLETDFRGYWLCSKHAAEHMDAGSIIKISSNHAFQTMSRHFPYNALKVGINGMTRAMALNFGPEIRVNAISSSR